MRKGIIALSAVAALATTSLASDDLQLQLDLLKNQIKQLEQKMTANEEKVNKVEKTVKTNKKNITKNKILANNDNIKWDVDLRTAFDSISYKHKSGKKSENPDLMTTRLWLGMGYAPDENNLFKGKLSYHKAFGDSANHSQANSATGVGYANFDWVTNENATDNTLKVKEAYWLYMNDTLAGAEVPWTVSVGRRPSTDGLGINLREGMKDNSPLSHTVNVEFDGLSAKFSLDKVTGVEGMWWKLCTGRGLTNAKPRFQMDGTDYTADKTKNPDVNMYGFIFVPWDNGQYSVHTNWARAVNMIGFDMADMGAFQTAMATATTPSAQMDAYANLAFKDQGDMDLLTVMVKAEGIGEGIADFLDDTKVFASWAQSKTDPAAGKAMLGSTKSETGNSYWVGVNMPCPLTDDGRIGVEWNKGDKYWRSVTYGEDTMTGSKIAARGTAWEVYYNKPLTKALHFNARYTKIEYDYTGSQGFFGADGAPMTMTQAQMMGQDPITESSDFRLSISYRY
jgi:hypothetical protein